MYLHLEFRGTNLLRSGKKIIINNLKIMFSFIFQNFHFSRDLSVKRCNTSSNVHSAEIKIIGDKNYCNNCNPHAFLR